MPLIKVKKEKDHVFSKEFKREFHRLHADFRWVLDHMPELRSKYPNRYVAVKNKNVEYTGDTMEGIMEKIRQNNEQVDNFIIEYIEKQPVNLLF